MEMTKRATRMPTAILLAEDEDNDVLLLKRAFRKAGVESGLLRVRDGEEVIEYLMGSSDFADRNRYPFPDLLLLDLKLPRKSGFEVLKWIRGEEDLRRMIVVVMSSSREARDVNRAYDLGANSYVVKPAALDDLVSFAQAIEDYWLRTCESPQCLPRK